MARNKSNGRRGPGQSDVGSPRVERAVSSTRIRPAEDTQCAAWSRSRSSCSPPRSRLRTAHRRSKAPTIKVGPAHGTVIVVGGGAMGPEIYSRLHRGGGRARRADRRRSDRRRRLGLHPGRARARAGGSRPARRTSTSCTRTTKSSPTPTASPRSSRRRAACGSRAAGSSTSSNPTRGTKTEQAFHDVLARGGVVGGSSAGASILGDFLVRGAPSNNNFIMDYPGYEKGFGFLRERRHRPARRGARAARRPRRLDHAEVPESPRHLRGRRNGVGRARRHGDDHRTQQGVRVRRQGSDGSGASRSSRCIPATATTWPRAT